MDQFSRRGFQFLMLAGLFGFYLLFTFDHSLWNPDETRDAGIAREMYVEKNFVVPQLNGEAFLEKPPLYYWSTAAVYAAAGKITDGLTRLPAALFGFLGILFTFLIGRRFLNDRIGIMGAAILATSAQYFRLSHMALMDSSLAAFVTGAFYFYLGGHIFLFLTFTLLAFFAKGFVAFALIGVVLACDLLLKKDVKKLINITAGGILLFAVLAGPWVYGLWKAGGQEYLRIFFLNNNFKRFAATGVDHADNPFYLYFLSFPADFLPWTLIALPAIYLTLKQKFWTWEPNSRLIALWFFAMFLFLSASSSKRSMYLLPAFPAAALLCAGWLDEKIPKQPSWLKLFWGLLGVMVSAVVVADVFFIKRIDEDKTFIPYIEIVRQELKEGQVAGYDLSEMERGVFYFYLEKTIPNLLTPEDLKKFLDQNKGQHVVLLANKNKLEYIEGTVKDRLDIIYRYRPEKKTRSYLLYASR